jgi:hypothetical protein
MSVLAVIGATGLYLLFAWLLSAAIASWLTDRKGYGERVGLTLGLLLTVVGLVLAALLPGRPNSPWSEDGRIPPEWKERLAALSPRRALRRRRASR